MIRLNSVCHHASISLLILDYLYLVCHSLLIKTLEVSLRQNVRFGQVQEAVFHFLAHKEDDKFWYLWLLKVAQAPKSLENHKVVNPVSRHHRVLVMEED